MGQMKTPGVYIVEKNAFPNSVVEVATAVPAFIGYTEKASNKGKPLSGEAWRISSMSEYESYFGGAPTPKFTITDQATQIDGIDDAAHAPAIQMPDPDAGGTKNYWLTRATQGYLLYRCMQLFFQNGGGACYIVSVGSYADDIDAKALAGGIRPLRKEQEPTMVVIPETTRLKQADSISVQQAMLKHCGVDMKNRFSILDIWEGYRDRQDPAGDRVADFRSALGINQLDFAAAYYPWVRTTITQLREQDFSNIANREQLQALIESELAISADDFSAIDEKITAAEAAAAEAGEDVAKSAPELRAQREKMRAQKEVVETISAEEPGGDAEQALLNKALSAMSRVYVQALEDMQHQLNLLPPAAAMAGVYSMVDNTRGVWKAPANVSLNAVVAPSVSITHEDQEDLNVTTQGKSINAIRTFIGEGVLVWGARTLDGNSLDWRYINVRRTMIMLEESIRLSTKAYVFEPNVANTWVTIRSLIRNFLTGIWKRGGLAGASPDDAFSVHVGLGETMTPEDILEGILRVTVLVAITRPAEFIEITFQQQMQKS